MLVAHSYYIIFSPVVKRNRQGNLCLCLREFSHIIGKNNSPQRRILGVCTLDTRPIGVFDSGLGGLTALRELSRLLPAEDIIYFGDTGRVPYGGRSRETLIRYARQDVAFLRTFDLKGIVVACGTVSTTALDVLTAENDIPIWGVVEPASDAAVQATPHWCRHTFATRLHAAGAQELEQKRLLGHANKDVTEHYTHTDLEQLRAAIRLLA